MAKKKPKFRKSYEDRRKLENYIKSARRTATIARKQGQEVYFTEVKTLSDFSSRDEFNKYINSIKRFNRENRYYVNRRGVAFKVQDIKKANELIKKENKIRRKQRKQISNLKQTIGGEYNTVKLNKALRVVKDERERIFEDLKPVNIESYSSEKQLKKRITSLKRNVRNPELKNKRLRDNYLKALRNQRKQGAMTSKQFREMSKSIKRLSVSDFTKWFYQEESSVDAFNLWYVNFMESEIKQSFQEVQTSLSKFVRRTVKN